MKEPGFRSRRAVASFAVVGLALAGCYPAANISDVSQLDTVTTAYTLDAGFTSYTTFTIPGFDGGYGFIPEITPDGGAADGGTIDHQYDTYIMGLVAQNFESYGYTFVAEPTGPTSFVVPIGTNTSNYYYYNWWPYYCVYYPYYSCGGWSYYPYPIYTAYDIGTLFIGMAFPDASTNTFTPIWAAVIRGVQAYSAVPTQARVSSAINNAFLQSSYLDKNVTP